MTIALTTPDPVIGSVDDVVFPPELEDALMLLPEKNLTEQVSLPDRVLDWQTPDTAACLSQCLESFYGSVEMGGADQGVRRICATCPLQQACITHALVYEPWGVWGLTERERGALGGVHSRSKSTRGITAPRRAASMAIASGIDPHALAGALEAVFAHPEVSDGADDLSEEPEASVVSLRVAS